jgi:hypothetical protein
MEITREENGGMERNEPTDLSRELSSFLSFISMSSILITSLLTDFLNEFDSSYKHSRLRLQSSNHSFLQQHSRKRNRNDSVLDEKHIHLLNMMKSFMVFSKTINSSWYIRPRAIDWTRLFMDFVPADQPERFQSIFRISPTLFQYICSVLHNDMVTSPPKGLENLPNRKLAVERQVALAL